MRKGFSTAGSDKVFFAFCNLAAKLSEFSYDFDAAFKEYEHG